MAPFIPRYIVFKSKYTDQFIRFVDESDNSQYRFVKCNGTAIESPLSKFSVEKSKVCSDLFHIRCCYSNKYWRRSSENEDYIAAAADKPEVDRSKWSCTLFKLIQADNDLDKTLFRFQHVQLGKILWYSRYDNPYRSCLIARYSTHESDGADLFNVINWESLVILPKYLAFKGDNGKYVRYRGENGDDHMEFGCDDIGATKVANEIVTNMDGSIRVMLEENGKFWEANPNWIYPTSTRIWHSPETSFWPVKLGPVGRKDNAIALKCLSNKRFLRRTDYDGVADCLAAASWAMAIDNQAYLEVEEPLVSRKIYDVDFHLGDARVYNERIQELSTDEVSNKSETEIKNSSLSLAYEENTTFRYSSSTSVKFGTEMEFSAGIPLIEGLLDIGISSSFSLEFGKKYAWGAENTKTNNLAATISVVVPPKMRVTVQLVATKGTCDVPFSYAQRDTYTNGKQITYVKDDGVYTGSNYFGFNFVVKEEKIAG